MGQLVFYERGVYFVGMAVGVGPGRGPGAPRQRVRGARRGRGPAAGAELGGPQALGARRGRPPPHEAPPQGAPIRPRKAHESAQKSRKES